MKMRRPLKRKKISFLQRVEAVRAKNIRRARMSEKTKLAIVHLINAATIPRCWLLRWLAFRVAVPTKNSESAEKSRVLRFTAMMS